MTARLDGKRIEGMASIAMVKWEWTAVMGMGN